MRIVCRNPVLDGKTVVLHEGPTNLDNARLRCLRDTDLLGFDIGYEVARIDQEVGEAIFVLEVLEWDWIPLGVFNPGTLRVDPKVRFVWRAEPVPSGWVTGACISSGEHPTNMVLAENLGDTPESLLEAVKGLPYCDQLVEVRPDRVIFLSEDGFDMEGSETARFDGSPDTYNRDNRTAAEWAKKYGVEPPSDENPRGWRKEGYEPTPFDEPITTDHFWDLHHYEGS